MSRKKPWRPSDSAPSGKKVRSPRSGEPSGLSATARAILDRVAALRATGWVSNVIPYRPRKPGRPEKEE